MVEVKLSASTSYGHTRQFTGRLGRGTLLAAPNVSQPRLQRTSAAVALPQPALDFATAASVSLRSHRRSSRPPSSSHLDWRPTLALTPVHLAPRRRHCAADAVHGYDARRGHAAVDAGDRAALHDAHERERPQVAGALLQGRATPCRSDAKPQTGPGLSFVPHPRPSPLSTLYTPKGHSNGPQ